MSAIDMDKMNALVAEHVMGWVDVGYRIGGYGDGRNGTTEGPWYIWQGRPSDKASAPYGAIPGYSYRIVLAWQLVEKLKLGIEPSYMPGKWYCWSPGKKAEGSVGDTAPLAICFAALYSVGVEIPTIGD